MRVLSSGLECANCHAHCTSVLSEELEVCCHKREQCANCHKHQACAATGTRCVPDVTGSRNVLSVALGCKSLLSITGTGNVLTLTVPYTSGVQTATGSRSVQTITDTRSLLSRALGMC